MMPQKPENPLVNVPVAPPKSTVDGSEKQKALALMLGVFGVILACAAVVFMALRPATPAPDAEPSPGDTTLSTTLPANEEVHEDDTGNPIMDVLTASNRTRAQVAAVRSELVSTVPRAVLCMDYSGLVTPPENNRRLCENVEEGTPAAFVWPDLAPYRGTWGGCEFVVERDFAGHIQYCATAVDGTVFTCTQLGCTP